MAKGKGAQLGAQAEKPRPSHTQKCTEIVMDSIQHYIWGTDMAIAPRRIAPLPMAPYAEKSEVQVSAVISTYLLTHLHHVLQRAEYGANREGRAAMARNYAQLRKLLCLDARSLEMEAASEKSEDLAA